MGVTIGPPQTQAIKRLGEAVTFLSRVRNIRMPSRAVVFTLFSDTEIFFLSISLPLRSDLLFAACIAESSSVKETVAQHKPEDVRRDGLGCLRKLDT